MDITRDDPDGPDAAAARLQRALGGPRRFSAISLDLDDTLWPVWPAIEQAEAVLLQWLEARAPATARLWSVAGEPARLRKVVQGRHPERLHDLGFLRQEMIREALVGAGEDPLLVAPAFEVFYKARQQVTLYAGVLQALERLAARLPLVAVSNGNAAVLDMPAGRYFHSAVSAADAGCAKPDPAIFTMAAGRLGCAPAHMLHIGDDARLDVEGARAAGMPAIWLSREAECWPLDTPAPPQVRHLDEVVAWLESGWRE